MKIPVVDHAECTDCEGCLSLAPEVFTKNEAGIVTVAELSHYPEEDVNEAIKNCPCQCIRWEEE